MLAQIGGVQFTISPVNMHGTDRASRADFVDKPVVGSRMPLEFVGDGEEIVSFVGRLFPKNLGGLDQFGVLRQMRAQGDAYLLMRGDGASLGWFVVVGVQEHSAFLAADGVGQVVEFELALKRDSTPQGGFAAAMFSLF